MAIVRVEVEGVGPFSSRRVFELGPGAVVFVGPNESGKSTLVEVLGQLIDPDPQVEIAPFLRTNPPPERSRATLAMSDSDGGFRVAIDFDARTLGYQEDGGPILEGPPSAVARAVRDRLALPGRGPYERLFVTSSSRVTPSPAKYMLS